MSTHKIFIEDFSLKMDKWTFCVKRMMVIHNFLKIYLSLFLGCNLIILGKVLNSRMMMISPKDNSGIFVTIPLVHGSRNLKDFVAMNILNKNDDLILTDNGSMNIKQNQTEKYFEIRFYY